MLDRVKHALHNFLMIEVYFEIPISQNLLWLWKICKSFSCSLTQGVEQKIQSKLSLNTIHNRFLTPYESILEEWPLSLSLRHKMCTGYDSVKSNVDNMIDHEQTCYTPIFKYFYPISSKKNCGLNINFLFIYLWKIYVSVHFIL